MSDNLFNKEEPLISLTEPSKLKAGSTIWYEGDISFGEEILKLQAEGKLPVSPYTIPLPYLSLSQVELYQRCPQQFYHRYILGEKSPPAVAMIQGTVIHKAVEVGYKHVMANKTLPSLDMTLEAYSDSLDENMQADFVWEDGEDETYNKDKGKVKDQGVAIVKTWHKNKLPKVKPMAVERSFITDFGGIPVVGRIDFIDRTETPPNAPDGLPINPLQDIVVDNKVVNKTYSQTAVDNKMQMSIYSHATGLTKQRYDLFVKTKTPKLQDLLTSRNPADVRWAVKTFVEVAKSIAMGSFPMCSPEAWNCSARFCGYWSKCRGAV